MMMNMKKHYIQPATQVMKAQPTSILMASGSVKTHGTVGNIPNNTPLYWATIGAGPGATACSGV